LTAGGWHALIIAPKKLVLDNIDTWLARVTGVGGSGRDVDMNSTG
jgi:hypothetical protein